MRLWVDCIHGVIALERFAADLDRFNALASRHNPFLSSGFLRCYAREAEYYTPGEGERLYLIHERVGSHGDRLIGIAPLRLSMEMVAPSIGPLRLQGARLTTLAPLDTERPGILCAPEDEPRVAAALIDHLCTRERGWGLLEFAGQLPGAPLYKAMYAAENGAFRARDVSVEPYNEIPIAWSDLHAYFRSLVKKMRSNISRQARKLFAFGTVEIVLAEGAQAVSAWFDAYCDLDSRSWKHGTQSSIQRHPRRVSFYREVVAGRAGLDPSFIGILLDGVLIAGLLAGSNSTASPARHGAWCLEMAYDESRAELGPGQLLLLVAMGEAIRRGDRFLNYLQNFAYYKHRWGAESIPVVNVQLLRRVSLHNVRASIGEWVKRIKDRRPANGPAAEPEGEGSEPTRAAAQPRGTGTVVSRGAGAADAPGPTGTAENPRPTGAGETPAPTRARHLAAQALLYADPGVRRLDREQASRYLPFDIEL
jgi:hypothetical protein